MTMQDELQANDFDLDIFDLEKESALNYRNRRKEAWGDNYMLHRDTVITNRLTQRQTINIPLMKYVINTILKDNDNPPNLFFNSLDNEEQREIYYNEYWKEMARKNKLDLQDYVDKKQACLFGRTFKKLNIVDGKVQYEVIDPAHMGVHRKVDPTILETAPCLIQTDIFRTLRSILTNDEYDEGERERLGMYIQWDSNTEEKDETFESALEKSQRLSDMGVPDIISPILGETYIELNEMYRFEQEVEQDTEGNDIFTGENKIYLTVIATTNGGNFKLSKKPLSEVLGTTSDNFWDDHYPFTTWGPDLEKTDFWSDGIADIVRNINKVLNAWISQLVENRTLRNFGMTFYDSSNEKFVPQTFLPVPWGFYPVPGNPKDVMMPVDVPDLSEALDEMQFLIGIAEKATAATSTSAGDIEKSQVTLGEIELALSEAKERAAGMQKFYKESWQDFGLKYTKLLESAGSELDAVTISKKGRLGKKMYNKEIAPKNWKAKNGYNCDVLLQEDKGTKDVEDLQKLEAARQYYPNNAPLREIIGRKVLEFANLDSDDISRVEEFESQNTQVNEMAIPGQENPEQPMQL